MVRDSFGDDLHAYFQSRTELPSRSVKSTNKLTPTPGSTSGVYIIHIIVLVQVIINEVVYTSQGGEVIKVASRPYIAHIGRVM